VKKAGGLLLVTLLLFGLWYAGPANITGNYAFGQNASNPLRNVIISSDTSSENSLSNMDDVGQTGVTNSTQQNLQPSLTTDSSGTPLQNGIKDSIQNLIKTGKPHPDATYSINVTKVGDIITVKGVTTLHYASPRDAGLDKWPAYVIKKSPNLPGNGTIKEGNYTDYILAKYPKIFGPGKAKLGYETRHDVIVETLEYHASPPIDTTQQIPPTYPSITKNILMGFTVSDPYPINWIISYDSTSCYFGYCVDMLNFEAGLALDYGLGLRLPATVSINGPSSMASSTHSLFTTTLIPIDLDAPGYQAIGLSQGKIFDGHEFVAFEKVFLGIKLILVDISVIDWNIDSDIDLAQQCTQLNNNVDCADFVTPFGKDTNGNLKLFPIPPITLDSSQTGLKLNTYGAQVGFGLKLQPQIGSDKITATWSTGGNAISDGGTVTYSDDPSTTPNAPQPTIPITSGHAMTGTANLSIDQFTYHFNQFAIALSANVQFGGILSPIPSTGYFNIYTLNLGNTGLKLGQHAGTSGIIDGVQVTHTVTAETSTSITPSLIPHCQIGYSYDVSQQICIQNMIPASPIPSWIKNNAKMWHEGSIGDGDFEKGIQYLINQKVIKISEKSTSTQSLQHVPTWVKNLAGMWTDGKVSDDDFLKGVEYLVKVGIIKI